jgi:integrase
LSWLGKRYPRARRWSDLKPSMLEKYVRELEDTGRSFDCVRHRLQIVRMAWRRQHRDCPEFVLPLPEVRIRRQQRQEIQCLESAEVSILLDWLKAHRASLWPMACLQALGGLRMYEAAYLRAEDVDLKAGTISIVETPYHKPKTEQSHRTIPLCDEALAALKSLMTKGKVQTAAGELFHDAKGTVWKPNALSKHWRRSLRAAGAAPVRMIRKDGKPLTVDAQGTGVSRLSEIPPRKLRAFFATTASRLGASDHALRGYLGHTGDTMLSQHYRAVSPEELRGVASLMNDWRSLIGGDQGEKRGVEGG